MKHKNNFAYIHHIKDSILRISEYIYDVKKKDFLDNYLIQDGVIRQIEIIGEATKNLTLHFRKKYPLIPWKDIAGMRDKLIHDYMGVDIDFVWETAKKDIPELEISIDNILKDNV